MNITGYSVEKLEDPFGLLSGDRYEFLLEIAVDEEDELYSENGVGLKVIYSVDNGYDKILQYHFFEEGTGKFFDFALEDEEEAIVLSFCKERYLE